MRRILWIAGVLFVGMAGVQAAAESAQGQDWVPPEEGAVEMFRQGPRAFTVGGDAGGAGTEAITEELRPAPGCDPIRHSKCSQNVETCGGSCTAYLNYYCKTCDCSDFKFC